MKPPLNYSNLTLKEKAELDTLYRDTISHLKNLNYKLSKARPDLAKKCFTLSRLLINTRGNRHLDLIGQTGKYTEEYMSFQHWLEKLNSSTSDTIEKILSDFDNTFAKPDSSFKTNLQVEVSPIQDTKTTISIAKEGVSHDERSF